MPRRARTLCGAVLVAVACASPTSPTAGNDGGAAVDAAPVDPGRFVRLPKLEATLQAAEGWSTLEGVPREVTSVFAADLEGDGRAELVLSLTQDLYAPTRHRSRSWIARRDEAGRWTVARNPDEVGMCRTAADLDDDGDPDLLCVGESARVLWNEGGRFDVARSTPLALRGVAMAAMAWDLDRDGLLDLVVSHWQGSTLQAFQNLGGGRFEDVSARWGLNTDGMTWCTGAVDFDDDGVDDLFVVGDGMAHENRALRAVGPAADGAPRFERVTPSGDPRQAARWFGTSDAGPMGLALGWIDDDDIPDLVVASDLYSGPGLPVLSARTRGDWRSISRQLQLETEVTDTGAPMIPWSPRIWDFDHDGRADVLVPCGDDLGHGGGPMRGASRVLLFQGGPAGALRDVADTALPTRGQFMTPSLVDLDGDDDLDLVLGGFGQAWQVYRNDLTPRGEHTLLRLVGSTSNTDALGARVTLRVGAHTRRYVVGDLAAPQATEHAPVDLAIGAAAVIDAMTVRWPSGYAQTFERVPVARRLVVAEPEIVTLAPASRHAPADGAATVSITVRPYDEARRPRAARVSITAPFHPAADWVGPEETLADGSVRRRLRAPSRPDSVVVAVSIDGAALAVRPRVWFDAP